MAIVKQPALKKPIIIFSILYFIFTLIFTWPLALNLKTAVYGYPGDNLGFVYYLWWWKYTKINHLDFNNLYLQEAPFGTTVPPDSGTIAFLWPAKALAWVFDEVTSYNLNLLLTFPLAGIFMYLFAYKVSKSRKASFLAGLVFAFCPYHLWKAYNHLDLAMIQWLPLYFWGLVNLLEKKSIKWGILTGLFATLILLTNFYYAYFAFFATIFFGGAIFVKDKLLNFQKFKAQRLLPFLAFIAIPTLAFITIVLPAVNRQKNSNNPLQGDIFERPLDNIITLSSRPWDYVLPSSDHPLLGKFSRRAYKWIEGLSDDWKTKSAYTHEKHAFVGYFSLIFGLAAIYLAVKKKIDNEYIAPIIVTLVGLAFLSAPPYIFLRGTRINFPSYYLHQIFPMFRAYARLGVLISMFSALLASLGVAYAIALLRHSTTTSTRSTTGCCRTYTVVCLLSAIVLFEFANFPPAKITYIEPIPKVYQWLKEQRGDFIIMEYPKNVNIADIEIYQKYHLKKFANPRNLSPNYKIWQDVENIFNKQTPTKLKKLGIKYIVVHKKPLFDKPNPVDDWWHMRAYNVKEMDYRNLPAGFKVLKVFDKQDVLEVL